MTNLEAEILDQILFTKSYDSGWQKFTRREWLFALINANIFEAHNDFALKVAHAMLDKHVGKMKPSPRIWVGHPDGGGWAPDPDSYVSPGRPTPVPEFPKES